MSVFVSGMSSMLANGQGELDSELASVKLNGLNICPENIGSDGTFGIFTGLELGE